MSVDGANAHVTVTNAGAGIPEDELPFVFHRFARSRTVGSGTVKGLGLGLYIAKGLITAHHGHIWADSVPGGLTSFHFTIPLDGPPVPIDIWSPGDAGMSSLAAQENWS
jgi:signal transduction histidine kinase